jgi:hypothetical protein
MPDQKVATLLRFRRELKEKLTQLAKREHRSLNQQIEFILESFLADTEFREGGRKVDPLAKIRKN